MSTGMLPDASMDLLSYQDSEQPVQRVSSVEVEELAILPAELDDDTETGEPDDHSDDARLQLEPWLLAMRHQLTSNDFSSVEPKLPCQILPHLLLGDMACASQFGLLKQSDVTHVLNVAGEYARGACVDEYRSQGFEYLEVAAMDLAGYDMLQHWPTAAAFIQRALDGGGKCLVHCAAGINRSGFIAGCELMLRKRLPVLQVAMRLRAARGVVLLNESFCHQLLRLAQEHALLGPSPATRNTWPP